MFNQPMLRGMALQRGPSGLMVHCTRDDPRRLPFQTIVRLGSNIRRCHSAPSVGSKTTKPLSTLRVREFPASDDGDNGNNRRLGCGILYSASAAERTPTPPRRRSVWEKVADSPSSANDEDASSSASSMASRAKVLSERTLMHFLPAKYPSSVAPEYARFASFCFTASVAGSAAMVLSTQTLLLAVGVVGSASAQQAGVMAGAFNWVMKDFVGQLGGVLFASGMGRARAFDADPKRWRMAAAMALDGATLLEILSPLFHGSLVLPVACIANIAKNVGFLTASASRAALHNAVAVTGNLGDVTAKSGSQSIAAGLLGTSMGIGMSSLLSHDAQNFAVVFCVLAAVHQGCNYLSVRAVALAHFNRHRLDLVLTEYLRSGIVMSPSETACREAFFPLQLRGFAGGEIAAANDWLEIGTPLDVACPNPKKFDEFLRMASSLAEEDKPTPYLVQCSNSSISGNDGSASVVYLNFFRDATGEDLIRGMFHASLVRRKFLLEGEGIADNTEAAYRGVHEQVSIEFPKLLHAIKGQGWKTDTQVTHIESSSAQRLSIEEETADRSS